MTFENRRSDRMLRILELLQNNPEGLKPETAQLLRKKHILGDYSFPR